MRSMATGVNVSLCSWKPRFTLQVVMSLLQGWDLHTREIKPGSSCGAGSGGRTDGLRDPGPNGPLAHAAHWEAGRSLQDGCELHSADMELKEKGGGREQEASRQQNLISGLKINDFLPLLRSPAATGPGAGTSRTELLLTCG